MFTELAIPQFVKYAIMQEVEAVTVLMLKIHVCSVVMSYWLHSERSWYLHLLHHHTIGLQL